MRGRLKPKSIRKEADWQLQPHEHRLQVLLAFIARWTLNLVGGCGEMEGGTRVVVK